LWRLVGAPRKLFAMSEAPRLSASPDLLPDPRRRDLTLGGWCVLAVVLLAIVPSLGTLDAPLLADDAAILGYVEREGALEDWTGPQYGLQLVAFWRPMVTASWWAQEAITGDAVLPLRTLNLLCHVLSALALAAVARRIGCTRLGALVAGGMAALFPEQGGTVTWVAGRVDSLCTPLMLLACLCALDRRHLTAAVVAFLACATKEIGFLVPGWVFLLVWARGDRFVEILRAFLPVLLAVLIAFVWRHLALGGWVGGYLASPGIDPGSGPGALWTWVRESEVTIIGGAVAVMAGALVRTVRLRIVVAGAVCAVAGAGPLLQILQLGPLPEQNLRLLCVSDLGLCLVAAGALARPLPARRLVALPALALLLFAGLRGGLAFSDTHEWAEAGRVAEAACDEARAAVAGDAPSPHPVLFDRFPPLHAGAYCLGFGVADRFRAPFPSTPRPIWPLRPLFEGTRELAMVAPIEEGLLRPFAGDRRAPPRIEVELSERGEDGSIPLDERVLEEGPDDSPRLGVRGRFPGALLLVVLYTEMGYESAFWSVAGEEDYRELSLRELTDLKEGCVGTPAQVLVQTADLGATRAYLELRAIDADSGALLAASDWLPLVWERGLHRKGGS
jgi:hypothetical protein